MLSFFREISKFKDSAQAFSASCLPLSWQGKTKKVSAKNLKLFLICVDELSFDRSFTTG